MVNKAKNNTSKKKLSKISISLISGILMLVLGSISLASDDSKIKDLGSFIFLSGFITTSTGLLFYGDKHKDRYKDKDVNQKQYKNYSKKSGKTIDEYKEELIKKLEEHLDKEEEIEKVLTFIDLDTSTFVNKRYFGIVASTSHRIIVFEFKLGGYKLKSLKYEKISYLEYEEGMVFDSLEFGTSGDKISVEKISPGHTAKFASFVNSKI